MQAIKFMMVAVCLTVLAGCSAKYPRSYNGPEVTRVVVYKEQRQMHLLHHDKVLKTYDVGLGFDPVGHKQVEGDGRTPEGEYTIDRRNPNSEFYLSIGISYPNARDRARAAARGKSPGGEIFIHGEPRKHQIAKQDWTAGCIAVNNRQMEQVYAMVKNGTPISIYR